MASSGLQWDDTSLSSLRARIEASMNLQISALKPSISVPASGSLGMSVGVGVGIGAGIKKSVNRVCADSKKPRPGSAKPRPVSSYASCNGPTTMTGAGVGAGAGAGADGGGGGLQEQKEPLTSRVVTVAKAPVFHELSRGEARKRSASRAAAVVEERSNRSRLQKDRVREKEKEKDKEREKEKENRSPNPNQRPSQSAKPMTVARTTTAAPKTPLGARGLSLAMPSTPGTSLLIAPMISNLYARLDEGAGTGKYVSTRETDRNADRLVTAIHSSMRMTPFDKKVNAQIAKSEMNGVSRALFLDDIVSPTKRRTTEFAKSETLTQQQQQQQQQQLERVATTSVQKPSLQETQTGSSKLPPPVSAPVSVLHYPTCTPGREPHPPSSSSSSSSALDVTQHRTETSFYVPQSLSSNPLFAQYAGLTSLTSTSTSSAFALSSVISKRAFLDVEESELLEIEEMRMKDEEDDLEYEIAWMENHGHFPLQCPIKKSKFSRLAGSADRLGIQSISMKEELQREKFAAPNARVQRPDHITLFQGWERRQFNVDPVGQFLASTASTACSNV
eukprot:ANDGO_03466.mRNA.1 hypothetical protein